MTNKYDIYNKASPYIIGFHGCDKSVADNLLSNVSPTFKMSVNEYDWLGSGMYFSSYIIRLTLSHLAFCLGLFGYV